MTCGLIRFMNFHGFRQQKKLKVLAVSPQWANFEGQILFRKTQTSWTAIKQ